MELTKRRTEIIAIDPLGEEHMLELWHSGELRITNLGERIVLEDHFGNNYETLATFPVEFAVALSENPRIAEALFRELAVDQVSGIIEKAILDRTGKSPTTPEVDEGPGDQAVREMFIDVDAKPKAPQPDPNPGAQLGNWTVYRYCYTYFITDDAPSEARNHYIVQTGLHRNAACALADGLNGIPEPTALDYIRRGDLD